jgi:hypothetical protein
MPAQHRITLGVIVAALLLGGCRERSITEPPIDDPVPGPEQMLRPGAVVFGIDSVAVGAPEGTLQAPLRITVERAPAPAAAPPFPASVGVVGRYYRIRAEADVTARDGNRFIVGLPRPAGAVREDLAIAVLVPGKYVADNPTGDASWSFIDGLPDPDRGLLLGIVGMLTDEPLIMAVVEGEAFARRARRRASAVSPLSLNPQEDPGTPQFLALCGPEFGTGVPESCGPAQEMNIEGVLLGFYRKAKAAGFRDPDLYRTPISISLDPARTRTDAYTMDLLPCSTVQRDSADRRGAAGVYYRATTRAWVCFGTDGLTLQALQTVGHELAHAIQNAYPSFDWKTNSGKQVRWFEESTAELFVVSSADVISVLREIPPRDPGPSLLFSERLHPLPYQTEDFWAYLGRRLNRGIGFIVPFFERGPTAGAVDQALREMAAPEFPDLGTAYWEWVRNQAYEKGITLGPLRPVEPVCQPTAHRRITFGPGAQRRSEVVPLEPLASVLFRVELEAPESYAARVEVRSEAAAVRARFYEEGRDDCPESPEARQREVPIEVGTNRVHYILVANTSWMSGATVELEFTVTAAVRLAPESEILRGKVGDTLRTTFGLQNRGDLPIAYSVTASGIWVRVTANGSGTLAPGSMTPVTIEAVCPAAPGSYETAIDLTFARPLGAVFAPPQVPDAFPLGLACAPESGGWTGTVTVVRELLIDFTDVSRHPCCLGQDTTVVTRTRFMTLTETATWEIVAGSSEQRDSARKLASVTSQIEINEEDSTLTEGWRLCTEEDSDGKSISRYTPYFSRSTALSIGSGTFQSDRGGLAVSLEGDSILELSLDDAFDSYEGPYEGETVRATTIITNRPGIDDPPSCDPAPLRTSQLENRTPFEHGPLTANLFLRVNPPDPDRLVGSHEEGYLDPAERQTERLRWSWDLRYLR